MDVPPLCPLYLGVDVSKGYADLQLLNHAGSKLGLAGRFDDTPSGHAAVRTALAAVLERAGNRGERSQLVIGLEASGGLERNWLRFCVTFCKDTEHRVFRLNPLAVKRFREQELHYSSTDARSALAIAEYLRRGLRKADVPHTEADSGALAYYRCTEDSIRRLIQLKNQLHNLLPSVHPALVQFCRKSLPDWVCTVLARYPTVTRLAAARPATLAKIPHVTPERAQLLVSDARESVAALRDTLSGETVAYLLREIQDLERQIEGRKAKLCAHLEDDPVVKILVSIPGIGPWTATVLRLELGRFDRFHSVAAVVAFAGLDPSYFDSGDGTVEYHISKRGRSQLRAVLWMSALSGLRWNPVLQAHYHHLLSRGKRGDVALTACAAKLLRIAFACVVSGKEFDPEYGARLKAKHAAAAQTVTAPSESRPSAPLTPAVGAQNAPVSSREAKRRRDLEAAEPTLAGSVAQNAPVTGPTAPKPRPVQPELGPVTPQQDNLRVPRGRSADHRDHAPALATHDRRARRTRSSN